MKIRKIMAKHPEKLEDQELVIKVQEQEEWEKEIVEELEQGKLNPTLSFEKPGEIAGILKQRTQKIIQEIKKNPPESIRELSRKTDIGLREVHEDLEMLHENGIIYFKHEKGRKKPRIPYSKITYQLLGDNPLSPQPEKA